MIIIVLPKLSAVRFQLNLLHVSASKCCGYLRNQRNHYWCKEC